MHEKKVPFFLCDMLKFQPHYHFFVLFGLYSVKFFDNLIIN
jgi:hypothetical protein